MRLDRFDNAGFPRGRLVLVEALWLVAQGLFVASWLPGSALRAAVLRLFGARIGAGVRLKPGLRVKFPWRLCVGDHVWLGENVWLDNLAEIRIGSHCCVSQGAYLCTGSHDWASLGFNLVTRPIRLEDQAWICAHAVVGPGVTVGQGAVLALGSVATGDLAPWQVHQGIPARAVRPREQNGPTDLQGDRPADLLANTQPVRQCAK
ncbi:MAG: WcaF family extracellular polysaccharide biosynthesis acetyltransferase [Humidesulfovibrio sp.]|nr:WcaF family extracellular polysaccharide biosynthesis acetyltransferase [Humidesulfovibrio sp.]